MAKTMLFGICMLLIAGVICACDRGSADETETATELTRNGSPSATQPSGDPIEQMKAYIGDNNIHINSFILIKDGETVEEAYFNGTSRDTAAPVYSCTKSVLSALVGIAIDEGKIASVDEKAIDLLDMEGIDLGDERESEITLKHLLTMSSGLDPLPSDEYVNQTDAVAYILQQPMHYEPGEIFAYTSGGPHVVSAILQQATGMETSEYAQEKLFDPLGISQPVWRKDSKGLALGGFGLELTPMQLAQFGCLYLNEGMWNGEQIVPKEWIAESTGKSIDTKMTFECEQSGYGYYWWMNGFGGYAAHGYLGQYVFVLPRSHAVAVFTSELPQSSFPIPYELMAEYVLPSLENVRA